MKSFWKKSLFFTIAAVFLCFTGNTVFGKGKLQVAVSFNAIREITEAVGGDRVDITTIIPNGTEPHEFEPKTGDLIALSKADVFIYNGLGMESWANKAVSAAKNKKLISVDSSKGITPIKNTDPDEIKEHGQYDPHIWLSIDAASVQAKNVRDAFIRADKTNKAAYEKNCDVFLKALKEIKDDYAKKMKSAQKKTFVTGHAAFAYFARDFGLKQNSVEDVFADGEPSAKKLTELVDFCKKNKVKVIFVEDMVSPKVSETLAKEVGAKAQRIYTIESKEDNKNYIQCMKENCEMIFQSIK
jgi:zinc transport system substrate-binding protein